MSQPTAPQRELVYCHQCENEWYRDEHGIICPECESDFTECIEPDHDPREEGLAPDPDEDDIGQFEWTGNPAGEPPGGHLHGHFHRTITLGPGQAQAATPGMGGLLGILGPALQGMLRNVQTGGVGDADGNAEEGRPASASPQPGEQQPGNGGTYTGSGPGYAYTITSSTNLRPRDAGMPQPVQTEAVDIGTMMQRMVASFGVAPIHGAPGHPTAMGAHGNPMGIEDLIAMFGGAAQAGMHGDAAYSQQELDRIISRLAEQHAAEQAPPQASEEAIEALPKRQICQDDFDDAAKAECSICIGKVDLGEEVTVLPCNHWFHHDCVKPWLASHDSCPHCRKGIMPKDDANGNTPRGADQAPNHDQERAGLDGQNSQGAQQPTLVGMFNRMREAFGSGSSAPAGGNAGAGENSAPGNDTSGARPANDA